MEGRFIFPSRRVAAGPRFPPRAAGHSLSPPPGLSRTGRHSEPPPPPRGKGGGSFFGALKKRRSGCRPDPRKASTAPFRRGVPPHMQVLSQVWVRVWVPSLAVGRGCGWGSGQGSGQGSGNRLEQRSPNRTTNMRSDLSEVKNLNWT